MKIKLYLQNFLGLLYISKRSNRGHNFLHRFPLRSKEMVIDLINYHLKKKSEQTGERIGFLGVINHCDRKLDWKELAV